MSTTKRRASRSRPLRLGRATEAASGDGQVLECSIGIMAYNEEGNIGRLLDALVHQQTRICAIREIIVLASGCTDGTEAIARDWARRDARIKLVVQPRR